MMKWIKEMNKKRMLSIMLSAAMVFNLMPVLSSAEDSSSGPIVVSMGDSYSSGEGNEDFYGWEGNLEDSVGDTDFLAHRSMKSWPGQLKVNGITLSSSLGKNWYFVASSGATTKDMAGRQRKEIKTSVFDEKYTRDLKPQYDILDKLKGENKRVDYVTLTMGGNDVDFSGIVMKLVTGLYVDNLNYGSLERKLESEKDYYESNLKNDLAEVYRTIAQKTDYRAEILVGGYPRLFDENGKGAYINKYEAQKVNETVTYFNDQIEKLINTVANDYVKVRFVDVEDEFRKAGAANTINKIWLNPKTQDINQTPFTGSAYSVHPNDKGIEIYRSCMQKAINEIEGSKPVSGSKYETVTFGSYEQDNNTKNGKEPIEWYVIEKTGDSAILMSTQALDCMPFNDEYQKVSWEACTLRSWLNDDFYNDAFSSSDKKGIVKYSSTAEINPVTGESSGNSTDDYVSVPSLAEADKYLHDDISAMSVPTEYAVANGAGENTAAELNGQATCNWWLRTTGSIKEFAAFMEGDYTSKIGIMVNSDNLAVRPIIKVKTSALDGQTEERGDDSYEIGSIIKMGTFEQDGDTSNGKEAIEWIVLDKKGDKVLLLSRSALEVIPYNEKNEDVTWETCTLRKWLNSEFYNSAFSSSEKYGIISSSIKNPDYYEGLDSDGHLMRNNTGKGMSKIQIQTPGGNDTVDKVFLLSLDEVYEYFPDEEDQCCPLSTYAADKVGVYGYGRFDEVLGESVTIGYWWTRSPHQYRDESTVITPNGGVSFYGDRVDYEHDAVRPAMWVSIK